MRVRKSKALALQGSSVKKVMGNRVRKSAPKSVAKIETPYIVPFDTDEVMIPLLKGVEIRSFRSDTGRLHVSDLITKCVRNIAIADKLSMPIPDDVIYSSSSITFATGHCIQDLVTKRVMNKSASSVYGTFSCTCGATKTLAVYSQVLREDKKCDTCQSKLVNYEEMVFDDDEYNLTGSVDLLIMEDEAVVPVECKSMAKNLWEQLDVPVPEHVIQVLFYWWMAKRQGMDIHDKVSIIYVMKEMVFKSPFKEFVLQPSRIIDRLDDYLEDALALKDYRSNDILPRRLLCPDEGAPRAKKCHVCTHCFSIG